MGENGPVLQVLLIAFPFFALVLAGYVAARHGMLRLDAIPGLNSFVLYFEWAHCTGYPRVDGCGVPEFLGGRGLAGRPGLRG